MRIMEYAEDKISAFRGLKKDPHNYELYLNLAQIGFVTEDMYKYEKYVKNIIGELKS